MRDVTPDDLSSRHVTLAEAQRLGVLPGWYTTKIKGTFVTGPHQTQEEAQKKILEIRPPVSGRQPIG